MNARDWGKMHMRVARLVCWLVLLAGAQVFHLAGAGAQGSDADQQACTPDAIRLCSDFIPDVAKVTACMKAKSAQLSDPCRIVMNGGVGAHAHAARHHRTRHCGRHSRHCG